MAEYHIYGIGAALVDTEIEVNDHNLAELNIDKGVMTLVDEQRQQEIIEHLSDHLVASKRASGGSAANTIIAASYFGAKAFYSCKVANDSNGDFYLQDLNNAGVTYHQELKRENGVTGKCLVMITPDAERTMNTFLGASESVSSRELHPDAIASSQYAYLEGYLVSSESGRAAAIDLRRQAEANGVKTALSLSDPAMVEFFHDGLKEMLGDGVDLLFCNRAEALGFTRTQTLDEAVAALKDIAKTFAITLGAEGALIVNGENAWNINPHQVEAIDTNGAGDMFAGAFIYAITHGYSCEQAGQLASRASAQVVSQFGPRLRPEQHQEILQEVLG
ncbi:adenosine kinase [Aestuariicella hydrocarbonica]|uniref:Adenosine kinase n=1 Tax=Pseudomaricurvus hydrocarbonicus TaxID=1470433 RepID=A0A9E5T4Q4_9GAMM|nr:adenosine kinase [Aestuariicella hydrocarbonica]NHO68179.1 adenosine kinase [Aestuariicella hydrocarbonica]